MGRPKDLSWWSKGIRYFASNSIRRLDQFPLSYTQAIILLRIPEEERESFMAENDVAD